MTHKTQGMSKYGVGKGETWDTPTTDTGCSGPEGTETEKKPKPITFTDRFSVSRRPFSLPS